MTKEELEKEAGKWLRKYLLCYNCEKKCICIDSNSYCEEQVLKAYVDSAEPREKRIAELEAQIEKLIDFVLSKTECCDVCPITDTCINSEGTCPYAGILAKGEEEVTREWLMQFISKEIKK